MGKRFKITLISLISLIVLVVVAVVIAQNLLTSRIEHFLANSLPENIKVEYEKLDLSVLSSRLEITKPKLTVYGKTTESINLLNEMSSILIDDISFWDFALNKKITIEDIKINNPKITYRHSKHVDYEDYNSVKGKKFNQNVDVKNFQIINGNISVFEVEQNSLLMKVDDFNVSLNRIHIDKETSKEKIPFAFSNYDVSFGELFYRMNDFDVLEIGESKLSEASSRFNNFKIFTKYSKQELSRIISVERDHVDLKIDKVTFYENSFGYHQDSIFYFRSPKVELSAFSFDVYRNKLVNDNITIKSLYSKILRDLTFNLDLSEIILKNGAINYSEKVKPENPAGELSFTELNATIKNLRNTYQDSENTTIDINAVFMNSTPIKINWYFDVNNVNDHFIFKAEIGKLPAQDLNAFTEPNLKVRFDGALIKTYFTIDGNFQDSNVDLKTDYEDFKVILLEKDGKEKNQFLSVIANMFIKKSTNKADDGFREGSKTNIERDKTKSVFNFIWLNARAGLLSAMTGNGKK